MNDDIFREAIGFAYVVAGAFWAATRGYVDSKKASDAVRPTLSAFARDLVLWPFWTLRLYKLAWPWAAGLIACWSFWASVLFLYLGNWTFGSGSGRYIPSVIATFLWVGLCAFGAFVKKMRRNMQ
jgi:hypothetical protein